MKKGIIITIAAIAVLATANIIASNNDDIRSETRDMMRKVHTEQLIPQKKVWKEKIDKTISANDKKELDKIRSDVKELVEDGFAKHRALYCSELSREEIFEQREKFRDEQGDKYATLIENLREIMQKYEDLNDEIRDERDKFQKDLRDDLKDDFKSLHEKSKDDDDYRRGRGNGYRGRGMRGRGGFDGNRHQLSMPAIWLFDGSDTFIPGMNHDGTGRPGGKGMHQGRGNGYRR